MTYIVSSGTLNPTIPYHTSTSTSSASTRSTSSTSTSNISSTSTSTSTTLCSKKTRDHVFDDKLN